MVFILIYLGSPPISIEAEQPGYYKKKVDNEDFCVASKKKLQKGRLERRVSLKKSLHHNPEIFVQFSSLGLSAPTTLACSGEVTKKLREKLNELELKATEIKQG